MGEIFFVSDTHFGHEKTCTVFKREDGSPLRPFANAMEMNQEMIKRWNNTVGVNDKVYHLGDVVINAKFIDVMGMLNGTKRLIRGNHDIFPIDSYRKYFKEIYGVRVLDDMILSHIPLHRESITERFGTNVHGHLHAHTIKDGAYLNVCVEHTNYAPIHIEEVRKRIKEKREKFPVVPLRFNDNGVT